MKTLSTEPPNGCTWEPLQTPHESDPTKAEPTDLGGPEISEPRDMPADERQHGLGGRFSCMQAFILISKTLLWPGAVRGVFDQGSF
jgi:hypothetical protein